MADKDMTTGTSREEVIRILRQHNEWRRDHDGAVEEVPAQLVGKAIDAAVELLSQPVAQPAQERDWRELPEILFDGWAVSRELTEKARNRTSHENVSDVLDAVVRLLKTSQPTAPEPTAALEHHAVCDRKYPTLCQACIAEYEVGKQTAAQPSSQPTDAHADKLEEFVDLCFQCARYERTSTDWIEAGNQFISDILQSSALSPSSSDTAGAVKDRGSANALYVAVSALYFDDSSDFKIALLGVVKSLAPEWMDEIGDNPKAVFDKARARLQSSIRSKEASTADAEEPWYVQRGYINDPDCPNCQGSGDFEGSLCPCTVCPKGAK